MNRFFVIRRMTACGMSALILCGLLVTGQSQAQSKEAAPPRIGKYQMAQIVPKGAGGQSSDTHEAWILDTETGRLIICGGQSGVCRSIDWKTPAK